MKRWGGSLLFAAVTTTLVLVVIARRWNARDPRQRAAPHRAPSHSLPSIDLSVESASPAVSDRADGSAGVEGIVVDRDEEPIGGATVWLVPWPETGPLSNLRTARTDASGGFVFERLQRGEYAAIAAIDERVSKRVIIRAADPRPFLTLRATTGARLEVQVVTEQDAPVDGAIVTGCGRLASNKRTHAAGLVTFVGLARGACVVRALADGLAPAVGEIYVPGPSFLRLTLRLKPGAAVSGIVRSAGGDPVADATVVVEPAATLSRLASNGLASVQTGADGAWRFPVLAAGSYRFLAFRASGGAPAVSSIVEQDGRLDHTDVTIRFGEERGLGGTVMTSDGRPVPFARVDVAVSGSVDARAVMSSSADERGAFRVGGLPSARVVLVASSEDAISDPVDVDLQASASADLRVVVRGAEAIEGIAVGDTGEPVAEASILALPRNPDARLPPFLGAVRAIADGNGHFRLSRLREGEYALRGAAPGERPEIVADPGVIVAQRGARDVRVPVRRKGSIQGRVVFDDGAVPKDVSIAIDFQVPRPVALADGRFALADVRAGTCVVTFTGTAIRTTTISAVVVKPGASTDLGVVTLDRGRSLRGSVVDRSGAAVAGATVTAGPSIEGDGAALESPSAHRLGMRSTTAREDGRFVLEGLGPDPAVVVADHERMGRSSPAPVPRGDASVELTLVIDPPARLRGKVIAETGTPAFVAATAVDHKLRLIVTTSPDGEYTFVRLSPGEYLVTASATVGDGFDMVTRRVVVAADTALDAIIPAGSSALMVTLEPPARFAQLIILSGSGPNGPTTAGAVRALVEEPGRAARTRSLAAASPTLVDGLPSGDHTACAIILPGPPSDPVTISEELTRGDQFAMICTPVRTGSEAHVVLRAP